MAEFCPRLPSAELSSEQGPSRRFVTLQRGTQHSDRSTASTARDYETGRYSSPPESSSGAVVGIEPASSSSRRFHSAPPDAATHHDAATASETTSIDGIPRKISSSASNDDDSTPSPTVDEPMERRGSNSDSDPSSYHLARESQASRNRRRHSPDMRHRASGDDAENDEKIKKTASSRRFVQSCRRKNCESLREWRSTAAATTAKTGGRGTTRSHPDVHGDVEDNGDAENADDVEDNDEDDDVGLSSRLLNTNSGERLCDRVDSHVEDEQTATDVLDNEGEEEEEDEEEEEEEDDDSDESDSELESDNALPRVSASSLKMEVGFRCDDSCNNSCAVSFGIASYSSGLSS